MTLSDEDRAQLLKYNIEKSNQDVLTKFNREEIEQSYVEMIAVISEIKKILEPI
jgi:hypothetical protein